MCNRCIKDCYRGSGEKVDADKIVLPKGSAVISPSKVMEIKFTNGSVIKGVNVGSKPIRGTVVIGEVWTK